MATTLHAVAVAERHVKLRLRGQQPGNEPTCTSTGDKKQQTRSVSIARGCDAIEGSRPETKPYLDAERGRVSFSDPVQTDKVDGRNFDVSAPLEATTFDAATASRCDRWSPGMFFFVVAMK